MIQYRKCESEPVTWVGSDWFGFGHGVAPRGDSSRGTCKATRVSIELKRSKPLSMPNNYLSIFQHQLKSLMELSLWVMQAQEHI